jgi:phosphatidate cytidylyltransferase
MRRILTSIVGIPLLVYLIEFAPPLAFVIVSYAAMLISLYEYFSLTKNRGNISVIVPGFLLATLVFCSFYFPDLDLQFYFPIGVLLILIAALFSKSRETAGTLQNTAYALFGPWYTGGLLGLVVGVRMIDWGTETGADLLMMLFLIIWTGDTAAYFIGKRWGGHRLTAVSPRKTVEGAVAGFVAGTIAAVVCSYLFVEKIPTGHAILLGALVSIMGQVGDLCESMLKRSANVKDSGSIIPGHGGMLDRLDSLLFGAPAMYYYFYLILQKG